MLIREALEGSPLDSLRVTADSLEEVLQALVDGVDDFEGVRDSTGLDIKSLVKLLGDYKHNDDIYHNGETILQHTKWVIEDIDRIVAEKDDVTKKLMPIVAMFHDLGKAYTYEVQPDTGKHTFYKHADKSVAVAEILLAKHRESLGELYQRILDLVRLHNIWLNLVDARKQRNPGSLKYLNKLMREEVFMNGHLDTLLTLSKADSSRMKHFDDVMKNIHDVVQDIEQAQKDMRDKEESIKRSRMNRDEKLPEIRALLAAEFPDALSALPDIAAVNAVLGAAKRYDLLKKIKAIVS